MDRRAFLRNGSLFSLAMALAKGLALQAKTSDNECGSTCENTVSIVLHGFMFYQFVPYPNPQELHIIAPDVPEHDYRFGVVTRKDVSQLKPTGNLDATFRGDELSAGEVNCFPKEIPSFSRTRHDLGELTAEKARFSIILPLPCDIVALNLHEPPDFTGVIGKQIKDNLPGKIAGAVCLRYKLSGGKRPDWIPKDNNKVNFYAQPLPGPGMGCLDDHDGKHFEGAVDASSHHFTTSGSFSHDKLGAQCNGEGGACKTWQPILPSGICHLGMYDLFELCQLQNVPSKKHAGKGPIKPPGTTGGPLCIGFVVNP